VKNLYDRLAIDLEYILGQNCKSG